jgi:hypothetical protein
VQPLPPDRIAEAVVGYLKIVVRSVRQSLTPADFPARGG